MMQDYDITVAVGASRQLDAVGQYFYYNAGSAGGADPTIKLRGISSGLSIKLKPGQGFRLPTGESETSWIITNFAGVSTIIGFVTVGDGEITDNRITGSVEVVDGGKNRSLIGSSFLGTVYVPSVAGQYSHAQIWNPAGSGKNLILEQIILSPSANGSFDISFNATPLNSLASNVISKKSDLQSGVGQIRYQQSALIVVTSNIAGLSALASDFVNYKFTEPVILAPNNGLTVKYYTLATPFIANFELFEESAA